MTYETLGVLAGAYKDQRLKSCLTHVVEIDVDGNWVRVLCKRVQLDNICDFTEDATKPATCPLCAKRDPRVTADR